jgi:hypothetical protein
MGSPGTWRRASSAAAGPRRFRREPHVDDRHVRTQHDQRPQQRRPVTNGLGYVEAMLLEQAGHALPEQEEVLGDHYAHGTSMTTIVGPPSGLLTASTPSNVPSLRSTPRSPTEPAA